MVFKNVEVAYETYRDFIRDFIRDFMGLCGTLEVDAMFHTVTCGVTASQPDLQAEGETAPGAEYLRGTWEHG